MGRDNQRTSAYIPVRSGPAGPGPSAESQNNNSTILPVSKKRSRKRHSFPSSHIKPSAATGSPANEVGKRRNRRHSDLQDEIWEEESSSDSSFGETEIPARKKIKSGVFSYKAEPVSPNKAQDKVTVGTHIDDPRIQVVAEKSDDGIICMKIVRETMPESAIQNWERFASKDGTVAFGKVRLDPNLFEGYSSTEPFNPKKKYEVIKGFIDSLDGSHAPAENAESAENVEDAEYVDEAEINDTQTKTARRNTKEQDVARSIGPEAGELKVGVCKMDDRIPVYAYLRQENQIWFRVHEEESMMSDVLFTGTAIRYEQIDLDSKFITGTERATRTYIRSLIKGIARGEETGEAEEIAPRSPYSSRRRGSDLNIVLGEEIADGHTRDDTLIEIQARVNMVTNKAVNDQENTARELAEVLRDYGKYSTHQAKTIEEQQVTIDRQTQTIGLLRLRLADLEEGPDQQPENGNELTHENGIEGSAQPSVTSLAAFHIIPEGNVNAGMLIEKRHRKVLHNRAFYNERLLLQELKISITGQQSAEIVNIEGKANTCYVSGDGRKKLIERPQGAQSLVEVDGRQFAVWVKREQITLEEYCRL